MKVSEIQEKSSFGIHPKIGCCKCEGWYSPRRETSELCSEPWKSQAQKGQLDKEGEDSKKEDSQASGEGGSLEVPGKDHSRNRAQRWMLLQGHIRGSHRWLGGGSGARGRGRQLSEEDAKCVRRGAQAGVGNRRSCKWKQPARAVRLLGPGTELSSMKRDQLSPSAEFPPKSTLCCFLKLCQWVGMMGLQLHWDAVRGHGRKRRRTASFQQPE